MAKVRAYAKSLDLINQLDEPEVLSQEWISENVEYAYFDMLDGSGRLSSATAIIKPKKLKNLLVPKQEEVDRAYRKGFKEGKRQTAEYFESITEEPSKEQVWKYLSEHGLEVVELVPKQEKVKIPYFIEEHIQSSLNYSEESTVVGKIENYMLPRIHETETDPRVLKFFSTTENIDLVALAMITENYEVEEEQKYYVINKQGTFALRKGTGGVANSIYTKKEVESLGELQYYQLTEQEIKDYDERYWPFAVKVEELEE